MDGFHPQSGGCPRFFIYGSYGTELQTPLSDIDFAVLPMPTYRDTATRSSTVPSPSPPARRANSVRSTR
ncbi:nucleotidyltransferase domain-containing protein [Thermanaeromonas sp. C210]|uniref:nucleotidyltransferase domain-containing protein n=1 Tax=Thermanaeromonas sp. C210 TaxID=2731925 RepID=UPI0035A5F795